MPVQVSHIPCYVLRKRRPTTQSGHHVFAYGNKLTGTERFWDVFSKT